MGLSKESINLLVDLVEIRLGTMHVDDRDDAKELSRLRLCRHELLQEHVNREQERFRKVSVPFSRRLKNAKNIPL